MGNSKVQPRFWIIVTLLFLLVCAVIQLVAVISPNWFEINCKNGTLSLGLWRYCGDSVDILFKKDVDKTVVDVFGYKRESVTCMSIGNYLFLGNKGTPVWFYANRILQCLALTAAVLGTMLFVIYSFTPRPFAIDVVRGFVFLAFTVGAFSLVGLFSIAGKNREVWRVVPEDYHCSAEGTHIGSCVVLTICSTAFAGAAAVNLVTICLVERAKRGDGILYTGKRRNEYGVDETKSSQPDGCSPSKPTRMMATCSYEPNIKFITAERHIPFCSAGELNFSNVYNSGLDASQIKVDNMENNQVYCSDDLLKTQHLDHSTHF